MNKAVAGFLSRHNFPIHADVNAIALSILDDMNRGLNGQKSDEDMIPTFSLPPEKNAGGVSRPAGEPGEYRWRMRDYGRAGKDERGDREDG